ncbi:hypothetical protein GCM10010965_21350 [Caldalkalibacillus thermarum]|uniref:ferritin family protein n=1 Tax=Caldalkalibacillus thermarum TaxID=296745 RepID=UPI00166EBFC6|nr:ferritin-like domain-containing protein [Caldalkalibacillus thermarum]GGK28223.1 hypothetical protein GCM10010965_21350 [Caldalkalibacillus thermarum]
MYHQHAYPNTNYWLASSPQNPSHYPSQPLHPQMTYSTSQPISMSYPMPDYRIQGEFQTLLASIMNGIVGEAQAIDFYSRLIQMAPNERHRQAIQHALDDEKVHLELFSQLYTDLSGQQPQYTFNPVQFQTYQEGLYKAYEGELEAYEEYRNVYLFTMDQRVRDVFLRAFTDEIEHAIRFSFLFFDQKL